MKLTEKEEQERVRLLRIMNSNGWPRIIQWNELRELTIKKYKNEVF